MTRTLLLISTLGIFLICIGLSMNISASLEPTVSGYILDNCVNKTEFESHGICVTVSNNYAIDNPEWSVLGILVEGGPVNEEGAPVGHAVNYRIVNGTLYVHDETWGWEYELEDWQNMTIYHVS